MFSNFADAMRIATRTEPRHSLPRVGAESEARMYQHELNEMTKRTARQNRGS